MNESFWPHYGTGVDSASNRKEYKEYSLGIKGGRCVRLKTLTPSFVDCVEICKPQPPGNLTACPDLYVDGFTLIEKANESLHTVQNTKQ